MCLSKLQKFKCAMVFWQENNEEMEDHCAMANAGKTFFAQFTKVRSNHHGFKSEKGKMTIKKVYSAIGN